MRRLRLLSLVLLAGLFFMTIQPTGASDKSGHVVMISVDGLAGFYLDDPKAEMPAIRSLAARGASSGMMKASTPTVTWPNHTTLVTGVNPARHGVVGNNYYDRFAGKRVRLISDPEFDKDQIVKVPTIYDLARAKGLKTASVRWPATRNATSLDWTIPDMAVGKPMFKYTTPAVIEACRMEGLPFGPAENLGDTNRPSEATYTRVFNMMLRELRPSLALLHITEVDHSEHMSGPRSPEAHAAIKDADQRVREVWEEMERDFPGKATLFIVSDHGFSPIRRVLLPNVLLRKAGLLDAQTNGPVQIVPQGGAAFVYVLDPARRADLIAQVRQTLSGLEGLANIVGVDGFKAYGVANPKDDPHAPDLLLFADMGCTFGDTAAGDLPFNEKPERSGSHGHDPNLLDLHAIFVAAGAGIKPAVRLGAISNTSVAPTIARLLGLSIDDPDGKVLKKALD